MAARNSINTRGVVGVIFSFFFYMGEYTDNKKFNIIVLSLTVAALSLWASFSQLGELAGNPPQTEKHHCHAFETGESKIFLIFTIILIGLTLGYYGVNVEEDIEDEDMSARARLILVFVHGTLVVLIGLMFDKLIDNVNPDCNEFKNRHNMFLCIALVAILVSFMYLLSDLATHFWDKKGTILYNAFAYSIVTFVFFFYATAPPGEKAHNFSTDNQIGWTLGATAAVFCGHMLYHFGIKNEWKQDVPKVQISDDKVELYKRSQIIVAVVLLYNFITSLVILVIDIDNASTSTTRYGDANEDIGDSKCLNEHDNILGMRLTAVGYWTLYIILIGMALAQTIQRAVTGKANHYKVGKFVYSDTKKGWNMPTTIVALTYLWLLVAYIVHGSEFYDTGCTDSLWREMSIFAAHTIGVIAVLAVLPYYYLSWKTEDADLENALTIKGNDKEVVLRPTNRFNTTTNKAQVAVDVNTPLNFA